MKILVLEDNLTLSKIIRSGLEKENFKVDVFFDGDEALDSIANGYHCFILDINVPSLDGISVLKLIRSYFKDVPILIISSNHELDKIKLSYEKGCNDYIKKPFFIYELVQKVKNLCKIKNIIIKFNEESFYNTIEHILYIKEKKIILARKEILFLELFTKNIDRVVTYDELETYVWEGVITNLDNIRALIRRLRKKLPNDSIKIVTGIGYTLGSNVSTLIKY